MEQRFETFTVLINRISRSIRKIKNQEMAEYNLRSVHISCLYYLYKHNGLTATKLCEYCEEDKATISRALDFLETNGYLKCETTNSKRYNSEMLLTSKGIEVGEKVVNKVDNVLEKISEDLSEEERNAFYSSLAVISDGLEKISKNVSEGGK